MTVQMIISIVLITAGMIFMLASLTGIIRLPDFFTRLHAQGVGDTLGAFLILSGMMVWTGVCLLSVKILLIFIIILLTNPIGTNLMMIAAINRKDYQGYASGAGEKKTDEEKPGTEPEEKPEPEEEKPEPGEKPVLEEKQESEEEKTIPSEKQEPQETPGPAEKMEPEEKPGSEEKPESGEKAESAEKKQKKSGSKRKPRKKNKSGNVKEPAPEKTKQKDADAQSKSPDKKQQKKKNSRKRKPSMNMNKAEHTRLAASMNIDVPEKATKREILDLIYSNR